MRAEPVQAAAIPSGTQGGLPRASWWVLGSAFILLFLVRDLAASEGGLIERSAYWGRDFINVWTGGQLVMEGRVELIYDVPAYSAYQSALFGEIDPHNYSYPPVTFAIAALVSLLPYPVALAAWMAGTGLLFVWAAKPWWPERFGPAWLAILTPAALVNIWAGHYGFLIGALFLLGWNALDEHPRRAGVLFGLLLVKPHLAILVPLVLLIRRRWEAIAAAAATVAVLVAATTLAFGWQPWHDFLFRTSGVQLALIDSGRNFFGWMSTSTITAVLRMGGGMPLALAAYAALAAAALAMVVRAAASAVPTRELALLSATATFLVLPYSFNYDLTVVMIGALWLLSLRDLAPAEERLAIYGFIAPQVGMVLAAFGLSLMPLMLLGLCVAQYRVAMRRAQTGRADGARCAFNHHTDCRA